MHIQTVDVGSSSVKLALFDLHRGDSHTAPVRSSQIYVHGDDLGAAIDEAILEITRAGTPDVISHRIVFGESERDAPAVVSERLLSELEAGFELEPLHLPAQVALVRALGVRFPRVPQVVCFDTAFHRRMPSVAKRVPLPRSLGPALQRYGYHGLSYEYVSSVLGSMRGRMVIAHLGSGSSMCALRDGRPTDTTMGFSPLGGLMMATRPGDLDPGIFLYLLKRGEMNAEELADLFYRKSGLLGVSGTTGDMERLLRMAARDDDAREAIELYVYQLRKHLGAMVAALGGLDSLVFTGGIGENSPEIRASVCEKLDYLGVNLVGEFNLKSDAVISANSSGVTVWVVHTNEALMLARHAFALRDPLSTVA